MWVVLKGYNPTYRVIRRFEDEGSAMLFYDRSCAADKCQLYHYAWCKETDIVPNPDYPGRYMEAEH